MISRVTLIGRMGAAVSGLVLAGLVMLAGLSSVLAASVYSLKIDGLACPFCAYGIEKQLRAMPGVAGVKISIKSGTVTVRMKSGARLSRVQAAKAVRAAGFSMRSFR